MPSFRRSFLILTALLGWGPLLCLAQPNFPRLPAARTDSVVLAKAFPLLARLESDPALRQALQADKVLRQLARRHANRAYQALSQGPADARNYADSLLWQPREIQLAGRQLVRNCLSSKQARMVLAPWVGPAALPDTAGLRRAWQATALGVNRILRVYLAGAVPRYPAIDSTSFRRHDAGLARQVREAMLPLSAAARRQPAAFYAVPLRAALLALRLNGRDEAARYEPLAAGHNQAPRAAVAGTGWARYPFSVILVPGLGPEQAGVALDTLGAFRCRLAAARYRAGQAPFVVVSGGHVHPNKTPYCEAVEMKKYLVETLGLPDAAVFVEPYARHTTTNLRNTTRLLYAFGLPADKPVLIVTDSKQSAYILGLDERCRRELGYVPYRGLQKISAEENSFFAVPEARQPDPNDPLDP